MKYLALSAVALALASPAFAGQHEGKEKGMHAGGHMAHSGKVVAATDIVKNTKADYLASEGEGMAVYSKDMEKIADVKDFAISAHGKVEYVILDKAGLTFDSADDVAVPHNSLKWNAEKEALVYTGNVEDLKIEEKE